MWVLYAAYYVIPCLIGASAIAVLLTRRQLASRTLWIVGFLVTSLLVACTSWTVHTVVHGEVPALSILKAFAILYYLPFITLMGAALWLRARLRSRALGVVLLLALFLAAGVAAADASEHYFSLVNARG